MKAQPATVLFLPLGNGEVSLQSLEVPSLLEEAASTSDQEIVKESSVGGSSMQTLRPEWGHLVSCCLRNLLTTSNSSDFSRHVVSVLAYLYFSSFTSYGGECLTELEC